MIRAEALDKAIIHAQQAEQTHDANRRLSHATLSLAWANIANLLPPPEEPWTLAS